MKHLALLLACLVATTACTQREEPKSIYDMSPEELQKKVAEHEANMPPELREKLAELRRQADAMPRPTRIDLPTLRAIRDEDLDHAISWYVGERLYGKLKTGDAGLAAEPRGVQVFYLSWLLEAEVGNGGFHQYFWNSSSDHAVDTLDALDELGASEARELLRGAIDLAARESVIRRSLKSRLDTLQAFSDSTKFSRLDQFDAAFMQLSPSLQSRRAAYLRSHEDLFVGQGRP